MEVMVRRIAGRSRKYLWLILLIPCLLGGIGWTLPVGKEPTMIQAEAIISLGNYQYQDFNQANNVVSLLASESFYEEHLTELVDESGGPLNVSVSAVNEQMVKLVYSDSSAEEAANTVNEVAHVFLSLDKQKFTEKQRINDDTIKALENVEVSEEAKVDQHRFLHELKTMQFDFKPAELYKEASSTAPVVENKTLSSKDRAVLGVLIGIGIAFLAIVLPELVRKA